MCHLGACAHGCWIGGQYYAVNAQGSGNCGICTPANSRTGWTPVAGGQPCAANQICDTSVTGGACVGCLISADCSGGTPVCDTASHTCIAPGACDPAVVISQIYGGGGNTGATYAYDYVELLNRGTTAVPLSTWSIQYASATGTTWATLTLGGTLAGGSYYLIQLGTNNANIGLPLPTADITGTINLSMSAGKVALVQSTTALSGGCPASSAYVDLVGFGSSASCSETAPAPAQSATKSLSRGNAGCTRAASGGNNSTDFTAGPPAPRNSKTPVNPCNCQ